MALTSEATTVWTDSLKEGSGEINLDSSNSGNFEVTWLSRSEGSKNTTNPEELLGAAHSACYSMALTNRLDQMDMSPTQIQTTAAVTFRPGTGITGIHLLVSAQIPNITAEQFQELAADAKENCAISKILGDVPITLEATLVS